MGKRYMKPEYKLIDWRNDVLVDLGSAVDSYIVQIDKITDKVV